MNIQVKKNKANGSFIRSQSLDVLRGVAILLVFGNHFKVFPKTDFLYLKTFFEKWQEGGWVGVDLFFVLSGFLISGLLFKEFQRFGSIRFSDFFVRRGFKIYPPFYFMMLPTFLYFIVPHHSIPLAAIFPWLLFLQDYFQPFTGNLNSIWGHTWSLAVEEQFYIFLPVLFIALIALKKNDQNPFRKLPVLFIIIAAFSLGARLLQSASLPYSNEAYLFPLHLRIDSLFFGVLISYFLHFKTVSFRFFINRFSYLFVGLGILLLLPAFLLPRETEVFSFTYGFTLNYLGSGFLVAVAAEDSFGKNLISDCISFIGRYSYSIYLWHVPFGRFLENWVTPFKYWPIYFIVYVSGCLIIGIVSAKLVEYPAIKLRDRFFPSRSQPPLLSQK